MRINLLEGFITLVKVEGMDVVKAVVVIAAAVKLHQY